MLMALVSGICLVVSVVPWDVLKFFLMDIGTAKAEATTRTGLPHTHRLVP